jgi:hypothetical protein
MGKYDHQDYKYNTNMTIEITTTNVMDIYFVHYIGNLKSGLSLLIEIALFLFCTAAMFLGKNAGFSQMIAFLTVTDAFNCNSP